MVSLFLTFLKIGAFTFGGGYAMIALLEDELVRTKQWIQKEEFLDIITIAESTPGPIAINCATFIGYKRHGVAGAIAATLGVCLPSVSVIYFISLFLDQFLQNKYVAYAFQGIQVGVIYLIFSTGIKMFRQMKKSVFSMFVLSSVMVSFVLFSLFAVRFSSVFYILICGALGILFWIIHAHKERREDK